MSRYLISYVRRNVRSGELTYGTHVYEGEEHPVKLILRWSSTSTSHYFALIWYTLVADTVPLIDLEA